jgi:hypothetical protein
VNVQHSLSFNPGGETLNKSYPQLRNLSIEKFTRFGYPSPKILLL